MPFNLAVALLEHGEWLVAHDRTPEADPLLEEAHHLFERLKARPWVERVTAAAQFDTQFAVRARTTGPKARDISGSAHPHPTRARRGGSRRRGRSSSGGGASQSRVLVLGLSARRNGFLGCGQSGGQGWASTS